ncbi:unnamed protein product [Chrysoparadoxa australica]
MERRGSVLRQEQRLQRRSALVLPVYTGVKPANSEGSENAPNRIEEETQQRASRRKERRVSTRRSSLYRLQQVDTKTVKEIKEASNALHVASDPGDVYGIVLTGPGPEDHIVSAHAVEELGKGIVKEGKTLQNLKQRKKSLKAKGQGKENEVAALDRKLRSVSQTVTRLRNNRDKLLATARKGHSIKLDPKESSRRAGSAPLSKAKASHMRRSSFAAMKELTWKLMKRPDMDVDQVEVKGRQGKKRAKYLRKREGRMVAQGWQEVFDGVFPSQGRSPTCIRREKEMRAFLQATTPPEHLELLTFALEPSQARDLPSVIKVLVRHYTWDGADDLELLVGGRASPEQVTMLLHLMLCALEELHAEYVPSLLLLMWLFARSPSNKAVLLREGVLKKAFRRLKGVKARGSEDKASRAMQFGALTLLSGTLWG